MVLKTTTLKPDDKCETIPISYSGCGKRIPPTLPGGYSFLPIELIRTDESCYVFDAKHVCFMEVEPVAYDLLALLRERNLSLDELVTLLPQHTEEEIREAYQDLSDLQADGLLTPYHFKRRPQYDNEEYEQVLSQRLRGFTIFITTRCNLGCAYCIYGGQYERHQQLLDEPMPWKTAKATMDFLANHSRESKEVHLDFFGGEPLLAFPMIERSVRYLKSILPADGPRVVVTISSNGTMLTDRIIDFLLEHNVYLQFSLDGGRDSHDRFRRFKRTTRGSYELILKNLQRIYDRDVKYYHDRMRAKGVLNTSTLDADDAEFFEHSLIRMLVQDQHLIFLNLEPHYDLSKDTDYFVRIHQVGRRLLTVRGAQTDADLIAGLNPKQRALYHHTLGMFFEAQGVPNVFFRESDPVTFTRGCMTGFADGAVNAAGDISICLKAAKGENFVIGNVREGKWYFDKIKRLNTMFNLEWSSCSSCFLQKFCDLCYGNLDGKPENWVIGHTRFCEFNRERYRVIFQYMLRVMENNPSLWEYLDRTIDKKREEVMKEADDKEH